jgi:hypothetical protein
MQNIKQFLGWGHGSSVLPTKCVPVFKPSTATHKKRIPNLQELNICSTEWLSPKYYICLPQDHSWGIPTLFPCFMVITASIGSLWVLFLSCFNVSQVTIFFHRRIGGEERVNGKCVLIVSPSFLLNPLK